MASQTEENYLKSLFILANSSNVVNIKELSNSLNVKLPTTTSMMKNLRKQGLVNYEKYKPISLTESGRKIAANVIRNHRLTEMFLVEKMGFGWEEVHEIAEQVEHINSSVFFERMDELLGHPKFDPHGSPIPDKSGNVSEEIKLRLTDCKQGDKVKLVALANDSSEFLKFLDKTELSLGTEMEIKSIERFDNSMIVSYKNFDAQMFSKTVSDSLLVQKLDE